MKQNLELYKSRSKEFEFKIYDDSNKLCCYIIVCIGIADKIITGDINNYAIKYFYNKMQLYLLELRVLENIGFKIFYPTIDMFCYYTISNQNYLNKNMYINPKDMCKQIEQKI